MTMESHDLTPFDFDAHSSHGADALPKASDAFQGALQAGPPPPLELSTLYPEEEAFTAVAAGGWTTDSLLPVVNHDHGAFGGQFGSMESTPQPLDQVVSEADGGTAAAFLVQSPELDAHGTLSVIGVKHQLGNEGVGDVIDLWLPNGAHVPATIAQLHQYDDCFRAEIDADTAQAIAENWGIGQTFHTGVRVGEEIGFTQAAGVPHPVLRHGVVAGDGNDTGTIRTLTGTEGGPGSSGAPVFDKEGHLVGQVLAYDPVHKVNLMTSADQLLQDLHDFADGRNLEESASPVVYGPPGGPL